MWEVLAEDSGADAERDGVRSRVNFLAENDAGGHRVVAIHLHEAAALFIPRCMWLAGGSWRGRRSFLGETNAAVASMQGRRTKREFIRTPLERRGEPSKFDHTLTGWRGRTRHKRQRIAFDVKCAQQESVSSRNLNSRSGHENRMAKGEKLTRRDLLGTASLAGIHAFLSAPELRAQEPQSYRCGKDPGNTSRSRFQIDIEPTRAGWEKPGFAKRHDCGVPRFATLSGFRSGSRGTANCTGTPSRRSGPWS